MGKEGMKGSMIKKYAGGGMANMHSTEGVAKKKGEDTERYAKGGAVKYAKGGKVKNCK